MTDKEKPQEKPEKEKPSKEEQAKELHGRGGLEPTRYEDWEINGKCVDF